MGERAILPDFPNCRACSYFRASMLGDWAAFFSLLSPSLSSWTFFFLFLYFILHPICRLPSFNSHYFPFLCLFHTIYLPLCLSFFSQRWVLVYGRLSQVCCIWRRWSQYRRGGRGKLLCTLKKKKKAEDIALSSPRGFLHRRSTSCCGGKSHDMWITWNHRE